MTFTLTCQAAELRKALTIAAVVAPNSTSSAILKSTRIEAATGTIIATNLSHSIRASITAVGEGVTHLDTQALVQKAQALRQDQPVTLSGDDKFITMAQGRTKWKLPVVLGDGFPGNFTEPGSIEPVQISRAHLFAAFQGVSRIISPLEATVAMGQGVYLDGQHVVRMSGWGMAVVKLDQPALPVNIIVPTETVKAIMSIFKDAETLNIAADANAISVSVDGVFYKSKLIEQSYPAWARVSESNTKNLPISAVVYREDFLETISRASAITTEKVATGIKLTFKGGECLVTAKNKIGEEGSDTCEFEGDEGEFGVSAHKLIDAIESLGGAKIRMRFSSADRGGILITQEPPSGENYRLVMGMLV